MHKRGFLPYLLPLLAAFFLATLNACSTVIKDGPPEGPVDIASLPDPVRRAEPRSRYGNPPHYIQDGKRYEIMKSSTGYVERGIASWYGTKFHGRRTSSGEPYDLYALTAAHKTLPLPTYVQVTNLRNGRTAILRVNDRGPFVNNRLIDLSYAAATKLGILLDGTGLVEVRAIDPSSDAHQTATPSRANIYLQIGAFSNPQNAERLRTRLTGAPLPNVLISEGHNGNRARVYRVRIGPIASVKDSDHIMERLAELGVHESHIVTD